METLVQLQDFEVRWYCRRLSEVLPETNATFWKGKYNDSAFSWSILDRDRELYVNYTLPDNSTGRREIPDDGGCFGFGPGRLARALEGTKIIRINCRKS